MKRHTILQLICLVTAASLSGLSFPCDPPAEGQWFSVCIEQNGEVLTSRNGTVSLKKTPFSLIFITKGPLGVLVNFSTEDTLYNGFNKDKPLSAILEVPEMFMGIGEDLNNPDDLMLLDPVAPHYLFYQDGTTHRFDSTELRGEFVVARRNIANYTTLAVEFDPTPLAQLAADVIYISLMYSDYDKDWNIIELQKAVLKLQLF